MQSSTTAVDTGSFIVHVFQAAPNFSSMLSVCIVSSLRPCGGPGSPVLLGETRSETQQSLVEYSSLGSAECHVRPCSQHGMDCQVSAWCEPQDLIRFELVPPSESILKTDEPNLERSCECVVVLHILVTKSMRGSSCPKPSGMTEGTRQRGLASGKTLEVYQMMLPDGLKH